jgi:deoxyribodipyrimidine photo-lyase
MLVSFASYHFWLHWRPTAVFLARQLLDLEPGIHYSVSQMQSGTTGINTVRICKPIKQARDEDPEGVFIRRYLPELACVPQGSIHQPHTMSASEQRRAGCMTGKDCPEPTVDHAAAYRAARQRMTAIRRQQESRERPSASTRSTEAVGGRDPAASVRSVPDLSHRRSTGATVPHGSDRIRAAGAGSRAGVFHP